MSLYEPISVGASGDGWVACYYDEESDEVFEDQVVVWSVCRVYDLVGGRPGKVPGKWVERENGNIVCGMTHTDLGLSAAEDCANFVGYMRKGEAHEDQPWWGDVIRLRQEHSRKEKPTGGSAHEAT